MSVPASPYGSFAAPLPRPMNGADIARVALGLLATIGLMMWAVWLAIAGVAVGGGTVQQIAAAPEVHALPAAPTPTGSTVAFDQVWTSTDGNTIVAGEPTVDISDSTLHPGASVIRVAVTLTNNGETAWSPVFTTFRGALNHAPLEESNEGDWNYSTPIVPHTSVTLSKVFLGSSGQFTLTVDTPQGKALFTGHV
ncbi:MAG TPA: hypothetical protein VJT72_06315 [Pseudonocardiaceae bacterium]|nr:hypothetical protein [Pseudonocardiaceae bacterium]